MNENTVQNSNFNLLDTIFRILGITGFIYVVFGGFMVAGGRIHWLIHAPEIIIVFSSVFFGLLSTFRADFLAYIPKALKACVVKPKTNADDCEISECGRRYAAAGGGLAVMLGIINTMSNLLDPETAAKKVAAAFSGVIIAVLLSQVFFVYWRHSFAPKRPGK